ncbi:hypothetical protein BJX61DRAFT_542167 [Aspergillus egyptiacus]|nr:hypothetical protein BJX61DRAFT_542167 [Aspergillus egyptiacus]
MPFRSRLKRALGRSDEAPADPSNPPGAGGPRISPVHESNAAQPAHVPDTDSRSVIPASTVSVSSTAAQQFTTTETTKSHVLELKDLWSDAYTLLQQEDPDLIAAYEQNLITAQDGQPQPSINTPTDRQKALQTLARRIVQAVLSVKDTINVAVSAEPHASLAWAGILCLLNPVPNALAQDEDALAGFEYISRLMVRFKVIEITRIEIYRRTTGASPSEPLEDLGAALRARIVTLYAQVLRYHIRLARHYAHSSFFRALRDLAVADNWKDMLVSIADMENGINGDLEIFAGHTIQEIDRKVEELGHKIEESLKLASEMRDDVKASKEHSLLESLPCAHGAIFGSLEDQHKSLCLEGTQTHTLSQIRSWCEDLRGKPILWLKGMAGTGKTTISRTFALACRDGVPLVAPDHRLPNTFFLGASFFFDRTKPDKNEASKVFTTITRSLANVLPDPLLAWERQQDLLPVVLVIVLDAMDECQNEGDLRLIFQLMSEVQQPEVHIRHEILESLHDVVQEEGLGKVSKAGTGKDDITLYMEHDLAKIRRKNSAAEDWPSQEQVKTLVEKADGLFIYAATACRFLGGARSRVQLDKRLSMIFDSRVAGTTPQGSLDGIYMHILQYSVTGQGILEEEKQDLVDRFRQFVGCIITLCEPLGVAALSELLAVPPSMIEETLQDLHSLLAVPADDQIAVKLLHLSFRDFLLDRQRCLDQTFLIDEAKQHETLLHHCLEVMSSGLRQDICSLGHPGTLMSEIEPSLVTQCIPVHLHYACVYWIDYLRASQVQPEDNGEVHEFLKRHVLYWLEVMVLLGKSGDGVRKIRELWDYVLSSDGTMQSELRELIYDATRFSLTFRTVIATAPLQTYCSALVFALEKSVIKGLFRSLIAGWVRRLPEVEAQWDALLQTLDGQGWLDILAFSPDGKTMSAALRTVGRPGTTVRFWDVTTGELLHTWEGPYGLICFSFSPDSSILAAAFMRGSVYLWDTRTGAVLHTLQTDSLSVHIGIMMFLSDGRTLAWTAADGGLWLWDAMSGTLIEDVRLAKKAPREVAFSPVGDLVAWVDPDYTLRLSNLRETPAVTHVVSQDCTGQVWFSPNELLKQLEGEWSKANNVLALSPDAKLIASARKNTDEVRLWDIATGACLWKAVVARSLSRTALGNGMKSLDFTADGSRLFGVGFTDDVHIWDVATGILMQTLTHRGIKVAEGSLDGKLIASGSLYGDVRIWDAAVLTPSPPDMRG